MKNIINEYISDALSYPGETLLEKLEDKGMTQSELALRMGRPRKTINEIIKGKIAITPETALQLEMVLDVPASFWNKRELDYQGAKARQQQQQQFEKWEQWLKQIPYRELIEREWISDSKETTEITKSILSFFGVASPEQWNALWTDRIRVTFRKSQKFSVDDFSVAAWLRKGELLAHELECNPYSENLFKEVLNKVRLLTCETPSTELYQSKVAELCREAGVAVVVIPKLSKGRVFGASQWLTPRKALIVLSLYHKTDDIFWFNFFHEAAHILLHSKKEVYIDHFDQQNYATSEVEVEANEYAREFLIPTEKLISFVKSRNLTRSGEPFIGKEDICEFADELEISPSIIVGRLQHDKLLKHQFNNNLKSHLKWTANHKILIEKQADRCD